MLNARFKLKKKISEEKNARKPIEEWTHAAASLAGTLEETISTAFSQVWHPRAEPGTDLSVFVNKITAKNLIHNKFAQKLARDT